MTEFIVSTADIRDEHRYSLTRVWDASLPQVTYILLNPSTADETQLDPTLKQCVKIARFNGFGGMIILNLYAYRATKPKDMKTASDPVGALNDQVLAAATGTIVGGWGNHADPLRAAAIRAMHPDMKVLKLNATGQPKHPLYVAGNTMLSDWPIQP